MSRDIRNFFGGTPTSSVPVPSKASKRKATKQQDNKRTSLTDEAERPITPPTKRPRPSKAKDRRPTPIEVESDIDSEPEEPLSSKYRKKAKRIVVSDDDDDYFDKNSASQAKELPKKSLLKKAPAQGPSSKKASVGKPTRSASKRRAIVESDESDASVTVIEEPQFNVDDEEEDDQENFPSLRKKGRKPKEAGLQKLDAFVTKVDRKQFKSDLAKRRAAGEEECNKNVVDSIDFINNFNVNQSSGIILDKTVNSRGSKAAPNKNTFDDELEVFQPKIVKKKPAQTAKKQPVTKPATLNSPSKPEASNSQAKPSSSKSTQLEPKKQEKPVNKKPVKTPTILASTGPALDLRTPSTKLEQWVDRHRPNEMKHIIGQHTDQAPANKLMRWLKDWARNNLGLVDKKKGVVGTSAKADGSAFRAALLSGPPGIGKTTTATLVCEALGLRYFELNASVARSKKMLDQKVSELIHSRRVDEYFGANKGEGKPAIKAKNGMKVTHVLIMDEVDGMSGNQDRSGVAELIQFIKKSGIPIICICNDRQSQKVRSLANYCFDLRFQRPRLEQIVGKMLTIAAREKLKISKEEVEQIVKSANQDMRQAIYSLQLLAAGQDRAGVVQVKDVSINIFEAARQIMVPETDIKKKRDLFFTDYSFIPLFVQENYLNIKSSTLGKKGQIRAFRDAAESIAMGEMVSNQIRSSQNWSLLPLQGMLSSVLPPLQLKGYMTSEIRFPAWFGKQSNMSKRMRLLRELDEHMGIKMSGPLHAISTDYIPVIRNAILRPLVRGDSESVEDALEVYHAYDLIRDDLESINELGMWNEKQDLWSKVKPTVKTALTRALTKDNHKKHFAGPNDIQIQARTGVGKREASKAAKNKLKEFAASDENEELEDHEDDENEVQAEILDAY